MKSRLTHFFISMVVGALTFECCNTLYKHFTIAQLNWPKVGDCFELDLHHIPEFYQIVKIIAVHPNKDKYVEDTISYVYNFINDPKFKKGKWYIAKPLTDESYHWFFEVSKAKSITCPW